jgi:hypothetical protein
MPEDKYKAARGKTVSITPQGYRELEEGGVSIPKEARLIALIVKACGGEMDAANAWQLANQVFHDCGDDIDAAIACVQSGNAKFGKTN